MSQLWINLCCFRESSCRDYRFYTNGQFQTTDRRKAKSKMGEEEANQDLTWKRRTIGSEF